MITKRRSAITMMAAALALTGVLASAAQAAPAQPNFSAQAIASGLTQAQAANLQKRVDKVLADIPNGHQVSATEIRYDGLIVTVDPLYSDNGMTINDPSDIICTYKWFCIIVSGTTFSFTKCQYWSLTNWLGDAPFKNNQTPNTVTRFYDHDWREIWTSIAYEHGTRDVTPFWYMKVC